MRHIVVNGFDGSGIGYAAAALCYGRGDHAQAMAFLTRHAAMVGDAPRTFLKANVEPGATNGWGADLLEENPPEYLELLTGASVLRLPGFVNTPPHAPLIEVINNGSTGWPGEGFPKPVTVAKLKRLGSLGTPKVTGLAVITDELARAAPERGVSVIVNGLRTADTESIDMAFLDPTNAGIEDAKPAAVTFGAPVIASTGDVAADIATALTHITNPRSAVAIGNSLDAAKLAAARDVGGSALYPGVGVGGGELASVPLYTSDYAPAGQLAIINPSRIFVWIGPAVLRYSESALVVLDDAPSTSQQATSLWQANMKGILVEQYVDWLPADGAAAVVSLA